MRSTSSASPTRVARLDQHRVAGTDDAPRARRSPRRRVATRSTATLPSSASRAGPSPRRPGSGDRRARRAPRARGRRGARRCASPSSRIGPSTAMRRARLFSAPRLVERRRHRSRIGVVAFVDQQRLAAVDCDPVPLAAALEAAHVGQREAGERDIAAGRLDRGQHARARSTPNARRGCEMVKVSSRSSRAALIRLPPPSALTAWTAWTSASPRAEGDDPLGVAARGLDQPVAVRRVVGDDRDAAGLEPVENLAPWRRRSPPPSRDSRCARARSR